MAAPNLLTSTTVTGKTALIALTTVTANVITVSSNTVSKLNDIILTNSTGSNVTCNVVINRSSTTYYIGGNISVPLYSTLVLLGKDSSLYLEEGDVVQANVSANASITMASSYELMS
jgi:hypothetical protein